MLDLFPFPFFPSELSPESRIQSSSPGPFVQSELTLFPSRFLPNQRLPHLRIILHVQNSIALFSDVLLSAWPKTIRISQELHPKFQFSRRGFHDFRRWKRRKTVDLSESSLDLREKKTLDGPEFCFFFLFFSVCSVGFSHETGLQTYECKWPLVKTSTTRHPSHRPNLNLLDLSFLHPSLHPRRSTGSAPVAAPCWSFCVMWENKVPQQRPGGTPWPLTPRQTPPLREAPDL